MQEIWTNTVQDPSEWIVYREGWVEMITEPREYPRVVRITRSVSVCVRIRSAGSLLRGCPIIVQIESVNFLRLRVFIFAPAVVTFRTGGFNRAGQEPLFFHVCDILTNNRDTMACATVRAQHLHSCAHDIFDRFHHSFDNGMEYSPRPHSITVGIFMLFNPLINGRPTEIPFRIGIRDRSWAQCWPGTNRTELEIFPIVMYKGQPLALPEPESKVLSDVKMIGIMVIDFPSRICRDWFTCS